MFTLKYMNITLEMYFNNYKVVKRDKERVSFYNIFFTTFII